MPWGHSGMLPSRMGWEQAGQPCRVPPAAAQNPSLSIPGAFIPSNHCDIASSTHQAFTVDWALNIPLLHCSTIMAAGRGGASQAVQLWVRVGG